MPGKIQTASAKHSAEIPNHNMYMVPVAISAANKAKPKAPQIHIASIMLTFPERLKEIILAFFPETVVIYGIVYNIRVNMLQIYWICGQ